MSPTLADFHRHVRAATASVPSSAKDPASRIPPTPLPTHLPTLAECHEHVRKLTKITLIFCATAVGTIGMLALPKWVAGTLLFVGLQGIVGSFEKLGRILGEVRGLAGWEREGEGGERGRAEFRCGDRDGRDLKRRLGGTRYFWGGEREGR